jgi:hypothetical protein
MRKSAVGLLGRLALLAPLALLITGCSSSAPPLPASPTGAVILASVTPSSATSTSVPTLEPATASSVTSAFTPTLEPATATATLLAATETAPAETATAPPGGSLSGTPHPAVTAVLAYLQARARTDVAAATALSCKVWKPQAVTETVSFRSMNAKLVQVECQVTGSAGGFTLVGCRGKMVTTYGGESRDWDLSPFVYQMTTEDGQWKMCGYHI